MFQLNFYPHIDLHHTAFRAVSLASRSPPLPLDAYRLVDFYLTFPFELGMIRIRGAKLKKLAERFEIYRPYRWTSEPVQTFLQMIEFQTVAVRALDRKGVIDGEFLNARTFKLSDKFSMPDDLSVEVELFLSDRVVVLDALLEIVRDHGVTGKDGLKARSGLMPFKYDPEKNVVLD